MQVGDVVKWETVRGPRSGIIKTARMIYEVELPDGKIIKAEESSLRMIYEVELPDDKIIKAEESSLTKIQER